MGHNTQQQQQQLPQQQNQQQRSLQQQQQQQQQPLPPQPPFQQQQQPTSPQLSPQYQQSAPPPTKAEVQRRLSTRTRAQKQRTGSTSASMGSPPTGAGYESDSSIGSASLPPLVTAPLGGQYTASPAASPVVTTPHHTTHPAAAPTAHGTHSALSAIDERQGSSVEDSDEEAMEIGLRGTEEVDDSEDDLGAEDDIGVEGQRVYKSGFLIKRQERRKAVWRKKWFVLRSTKLAYYKDNREYSLSRNIELKTVHSVVPVLQEKQKHPFAFAIVTEDRTFFVEALSAEERDDWVRAIAAVRKRLAEREKEGDGEGQPRRKATAEGGAKPVPVPTSATASQGQGHDASYPGGQSHVETHPGTWTSTMSAASASTSPGAGGALARGVASATSPPSANPPPSSYQAPLQPPPAINAQPRAASPSAAANSITQQMAGVTVGRAQSTNTATAPSVAAVNRRLSNPLGNASAVRRDASPSARAAGPSVAIPGEAANAPATSNTAPATPGALSPPTTFSQFVSSDEEEGYFDERGGASPYTNAAGETPAAPPPPAAMDPNRAIVATYLMKKSRKTARRVWRKRWFFVTSAGITYTKSHMDTRPITFIPLTSILDCFSVDPGEMDDDDSSDEEGRHAHAVHVPGHGQGNAAPARSTSLRGKEKGKTPHEHVLRIVTNKRRFDLCAPSEEEEIKWIAAVRALVNRERERRQPQQQQQQQQQAAGASAGQTQGQVAAGQGGAEQPATNGTTGHGVSPPRVETSSFIPGHGRSRSATQTARNAVADVVRRFHEGGQ